jgi:biopolymer transport protein ExbD
MRVARVQDRGSLEFNMTPMIDVTFLLIIFFLVSSHLAKQEVQLELDLPTAASGQEANDEHEEARRVTVNVQADGAMHLGSETVTSQELTERLAFEGRQATGQGEDLEVRIRCDRSVPYRAIEPIMLACARGGVWRVTFAVVHKEESE